MSLQDRYDAATSIINEHNDTLGKQTDDPDKGTTYPDGWVKTDNFLNNLKLSGGTSEDRLKSMSYEDILTCMKPINSDIKPVAVAKDIARVFRGKEETESGKPMYVSAKKVERMQPRELIDAFDPEEPDNAVAKRLKEGSRGEPFIVYKEEGSRTIDIEATLILYLEVKKGFEGRKSWVGTGSLMPRQVYRVGDLPDDLMDENPLYRGRPLRPDGTCDQTGRSWDGVATEVRQLIRVLIDTDRVNLTIDRANDLIDLAIDREGKRKLATRYQEAAVKFSELERTGNLPKLKVPLKATRPGGATLRDGRRVNPGN